MRSTLPAAITIIFAMSLTDSTLASDAVQGRHYFVRNCISCHSISCSRQHGPALEGIVGRTAGDRTDFRYSDAMREADIVWDDALLDAFLADPSAVVPGTTMRDGPGARVAVQHADDRRNLIAYLLTGDTSYDLC